VPHRAAAAVRQLQVLPLGIGFGNQYLRQHSPGAFTCDFSQGVDRFRLTEPDDGASFRAPACAPFPRAGAASAPAATRAASFSNRGAASPPRPAARPWPPPGWPPNPRASYRATASRHQIEKGQVPLPRHCARTLTRARALRDAIFRIVAAPAADDPLRLPPPSRPARRWPPPGGPTSRTAAAPAAAPAQTPGAELPGRPPAATKLKKGKLPRDFAPRLSRAREPWNLKNSRAAPRAPTQQIPQGSILFFFELWHRFRRKG
jgi:hypothetical protein